MKSLELYWLDAFTDQPFRGNPVAVVIDADCLSDEKKQEIAKELNVSETVFISKSQLADFKVQFFTPKQESALCGHGTVGSFWLLASMNRIDKPSESFVKVRQETKAGILPVEVHFSKNKTVEKIVMHQNLPVFSDAKADINEISNILDVPIKEFESDYPLKTVSTGRQKLFIPVKNRNVLYGIKPNFELMSDYCVRNTITGFHVFTFDTHHSNSITAARHFAPTAGVNEDPVTGIAAGALGCYLTEYGKNDSSVSTFQMEQGFNLGRNGIIHVEVVKEKQQYKSVKVGGMAYILFRTEMELND